VSELERRRQPEAWIAWIRLAAVAWAAVEVGVITHDYPEGYRPLAWAITAALAAGAAVFLLLARRAPTERALGFIGLTALAFDTAVVFGYLAVYQFEPGVPTRGLVFLVVIEAAVRYGVLGGIALPLATAPLLVLIELSRAERFPPLEFEPRNVTLPVGISLVAGLIVGGLVRQLRAETAVSRQRAAEAEDLRDQIGRRADQLEVVNRAARAVSSSLELDEAFRLFCRELRTALAFDRLALVVATSGRAEVVANVGTAEDSLWPAGTFEQIEGTILEPLLASGRPIVVDDMLERPRYREDPELAAVGLRSRAVAPLSAGGRVLGMISVSRREAHAFTRGDLELLTLLGRQLATAMENIRAFEAERTAAEELRRLSALRADFVSLVSHELRAPMASVIGAAATLRQRWRELKPAQRESFLALIEEETGRLAALVGDVLDTSRLEAGTFSYTFSDVHVDELVREVAALLDVAQEEVDVRAEVEAPLPPIRGDRERLRQVLVNLVGNAVKYTVAGDEVEIRAGTDNGYVTISVSDSGPGISPEEQRIIFDKFGRAAAGGSKPGAGLGLFIARSITEAHGGSIDVESQKGAGATFTVRLPANS
jgi:signal transduction histidine kinase